MSDVARVPWHPEVHSETVVSRLERVAAVVPDNTAVRDDETSLTYRELLEKARDVAAVLAGAGHVGEPAALIFGHTCDTVVAIVGALMAGRPYVVLDPAVPENRHRVVLEDLGPCVVLAQREHTRLAEALAGLGAPLFIFEEIAATTAFEPPDLEPDDVAAIFYTSGTTGRPKGVVCTHRMILHRIVLDAVPGDFRSDDVFSLLYSCSFATSVNDIFGALLSGGSVVMWDVTGAGVGELADWIEREGVTILHAQASLARKIVELIGPQRSYPKLRMMIPSGRLYTTDLDAFFGFLPDDAVVVSRYASTEAFLVSRMFIDRGMHFEAGAVPVGTPVGDKQVVIVGPGGEPVAPGEVGEIVVSSRFLSPGYWNALEDSDGPFEVDPEREGCRRFHTGDQGRIRPDGVLQFVGRVDDQVKVRGYRIELEEVVAALHAIPGIKDATATVVHHAESDHLAAYLVTSDGRLPVVGDLRERLGKVLPPYMIPSFFVPLRSMPLKGNGKIDTESLPPVGGTRPLLDEAAVAPRTDTEAAIQRIWEDVLGIAPIGVNDRFLDLGGDSLSAVKVIGRVLARFGVDQSVRSLLDAGTIAAMAARVTELDQRLAQRTTPIEKRAEGAPIPATYGQTALWLAEQLSGGSGAYNMPKVVALEGPLDLSLLAEAITQVVRRQSALRATFDFTGDRLVQRLHPVGDIDIDPIGGTEHGGSIRSVVDAVTAEPFDLASDLPFRVRLIRHGETSHTLVFVNHHISGDRISSRVLLGDLAASYRALVRDERPDWPDLPIEFADFAVWQRETLADAELERQVAFWVDRLDARSGSLSPLVAPGLPSSSETRQIGFTCAPERLVALDESAKRHGASRFMLLLASVAVALGRVTSQGDLVIGTTVTGRTRPELENLVGYFVNLLALPVSVPANTTLSDALSECRDIILDAFAHSEAPFDHVVTAVGPDRVPGRMPLVDVIVNYDDAGSDTLDLGPVRGRRVRMDAVRTRSPLSITFGARDAELHCDVVYDPALVEDDRAATLLDHLQDLLDE